LELTKFSINYNLKIKNMKKIILFAVSAILGVLFVGQNVYADSAVMSVLPATASKNAGTAFNISVNLDPQGNKICVVKGTLIFDNLTCKSIAVASGLMVQASPTCDSPSFTFGIPKCTTDAQDLMTISVKGISTGQSGASFASIKIIGVGALVPSTSQGGMYNITDAEIRPATTPAPAVAPVVPPLAQKVEQPSETQQTQTPVEQVTPKGNLLTTAGPASLSSIASNYAWPLLVVLIIIAAVYGIYYLLKRKKK
jgi:hypothetical protein